MKVYLGKNAPDNSYQCVGYRSSLEGIADDNECKEIVGPNILDFIPKNNHKEFIEHLVSKLRHGGRLVLGGSDIVSISLAIFNKTISTNDANIIIYGSENEQTKKGLTSLEETKQLVSQSLKITKLCPGINFIVEGQRQ